MDIWMSSVPGGGGGFRGHSMRANTKYPVGPQVTLNLNVHPPVLDTARSKAPPAKSTSFCAGTNKVRGHWWKSLRNMYNSLCASTPVTWVNPDMVPTFQPLTMPQHPYPEGPDPLVEQNVPGNQNNQPLWYHATPGSHYEYQDPLQSVYNPLYNTGLPTFSNKIYPENKNVYHKSSRPLNPEAKEWVPNGFRDSVTSSFSNHSLMSDKTVQNPLVFSNVSVEFIEITDKEIEEVRKNVKNIIPKKAQDHKAEEMCSTQKISFNCDIKKTGRVPDTVVPGQVVESHNGLHADGQFHSNCDKNISKKAPVDEQPKDSTSADIFSCSYATIARKSPEPPLRTKVEMGLEKESATSVNCVKQPLPKIFTKDKKYPKEKAPISMENNKKDPLPFRTASKTQKKNSRKFLKDLRDLSPVKSDCSFSGSEGSFDSNSGMISRLFVCSSPSSVGSGSISPKDSVGCSISAKNMRSQCSVSESSASSNHLRTTSESSVGSVESLDIEFGDCSKLESVCVLTDPCQSKSEGSEKDTNSILNHILGLDDSDSEDSDEETDDSDWDNADECDSLVLDESWETFGLSIPLITKSLPCSKLGNGDHQSVENVCDNDYFNSTLEDTSNTINDINKRWEEEVAKHTNTPSSCRVSFGDASVHPMIMWSYAYRNARRGPWEQYARDRARFSNRISSLESIISPVLKGNHRRAMYCKIYGG